MSNYEDRKIPCPIRTTYGNLPGHGTFYFLDKTSNEIKSHNCREQFHLSRTFMDQAPKKIVLSSLIRDYEWSELKNCHTLVNRSPANLKVDSSPFWYGTKCIEKLASNFDYLESQLNLSVRTKFISTSVEQLYKIEPSLFWCGIAMKFGIMTCFLRGFNNLTAAEIKNQNDLHHLMSNYTYLDLTRKNLEDFFVNKTFFVPINPSPNWVDHYKLSPKISTMWENPKEFSHKKWHEHVSRVAKNIWSNNTNEPKQQDEFIWLLAEKICAANAFV